MMILATVILGAALSGTPQAQTPPLASAQAEGQIDSAQKLMEAGQFREALGVLIAVAGAEQTPPPDVFILLATCHLNLGEHVQAFELFERGMMIHPQQPVLEDFYVRLLTNYVPLEQMKDKLEKALVSSPRSLMLLRASAFVHLRLDPESQDARRVVDKLLEVAPENPHTHFIYGQWANLNKQQELAIGEWEKTVALAGADARVKMDAYTFIGDVENRRNRPERAEAAFKGALEANLRLETRNPASAFFYAEFLAQQGRLAESQTLVEQILRWAPEYGPALLQKASHLARVRKPEEAVIAAEQALAGKDLNPQQIRAAHVLLARTYFQLKRIADAERHQQWLKSQ